ncbi:MAG: T9SS type A sorting domain-containing protein [Bacteroidia bacterium]
MLRYVLFLNAFLLCLCAFAQDADPTFGDEGYLTIDTDWYDEAIDMAALPDGSFVVLIQSGRQDSLYFDMDLCLVRFSAEGRIDTTFGDSGLKRFDSGPGYYSLGKSLLVDESGRILVLSTNESAEGGKLISVAAFLTNGESDATFAENGNYLGHFISQLNDAGNFKLYESRIVVAATAYDSGSVHRELPALLVLDAEGKPDSTFGGTGKMVFDIGNGIIYPISAAQDGFSRHNSGGFFSDVVMQGNRIIAGGAFSSGLDYRCLMAAILPDGTVDSTFFYQGLLVFDQAQAQSSWIRQMALTAQDDVLCAIRYSNQNTPPLNCMALCNYTDLPQPFTFNQLPYGQINGLKQVANGRMLFSASVVDEENYPGFVNSVKAGLFSAAAGASAADTLFLGSVFEGISCEAEAICEDAAGGILLAVKSANEDAQAGSNVYIMRLSAITGISAPKPADEILVYPVPAKGEFTIKCPSGGKISIYNSSGRQVFSGIAESTNMLVSLPEQASGLYHIIVETPQGIRIINQILN